MKTVKRFTSIFLALVFLLSSMSILSQAASEPNRLIETDGFIYYILDFKQKTAELYRIKDSALGKDGTLIIPGVINGYKIIELTDYTFLDFTVKDNIRKIIISDGIKKYNANIYDPGDGPMGGCKNLKEIIIPDDFSIGYAMLSNSPKLEKVTFKGKVNYIGDYAFSNCTALKELKIPEGVVSIGENAFAYCKSLKKVTFPSTLKSIDRGAFCGCKSLEGKLKLPKSLKKVGIGAFAFCTKLTGFRIADGNKYLSQKGGVLFDKKKTKIYCYLSGKETKEYKIPSTVKSVSRYAFAGTKHLNKLTFSDKITKIPEDTFYESKVKHIVFSKSVKEIKDDSLSHNKSLRSLTVKNKKCKMPGHWDYKGKKITVYGYKNSTAQTFAKKAKLKFVKLK